jgi:glycosyltransferase involved in cell wall biosynthesis
LALKRFGVSIPHFLEEELEYIERKSLGRYSRDFFTDQDFYIALSSTGLETAIKASKFDKKFICDRGSTHIVHQDELLASEYSRWGMKYKKIDPRVVDRELQEYELACAITVPSTFAAGGFIEKGVDSKKIKIIPYGVDSRFFVPSTDPLSHIKNRILFVGNFTLQKGVFDLLSTFKKLRAPGKKLILVGSRDEHVWSHAKKSGYVDDSVEWLGPLSKKELLVQYQQAAFMVFPTIQDGWGLVVTEAMAAGCPVISSRNSGSSDYIEHGDDGFLFDAKDQVGLLHYMEMMCSDDSLRDSVAINARTKALEFGNWSAYGSAFHSLLKDLSKSA